MSLVVWLMIVALVLFLVLIDVPSPRTLYYCYKIRGPWGVPILGAFLEIMMLSPKAVKAYGTHLMTTYGRMVSLTACGAPIIGLFDPKDIGHVLASSKNISKGIEYTIMRPWLGNGLITSAGDKWRSDRRLITPAFHFRVLEESLPVMIKYCKDLARSLLGSEGEPVDIRAQSSTVLLSVMAETGMGITLDHVNARQYVLDTELTRMKVLERVLTVFQLKTIYWVISKNYREFQGAFKRRTALIKKVIADKKNMQQKKIDSTTVREENQNNVYYQGRLKRAFLENMLNIARNNPGSFSDQDVHDQVETFMFTGHDTLANAVTFLMFYLGHYPEIQERVYEEIQEMLGKEEVTMTNTAKLVYLDRVIKETLRLYPSVPYFSRKLEEDIILDDGVVLPRSVNVVIPPFFVHRNEKYFSDPEKFDPDRFTEDETARRHPFAYFPFSAGPRNCIGQRYANTLLKVMSVTILRACRVETVTRQEDVDPIPLIIMSTLSPVMCSFLPRRPV